MKSFAKRIIALMSIFLWFLSTPFAQVPPFEAANRQIDDILSRKVSAELKPYLMTVSGAAWYPRLEEYLLKRARQLVIENELEFAKAVSLAMIDANLDNKAAVDLYQSVQEAIKRRDDEMRRIAEEEALAAYKAASEGKSRQATPTSVKAATTSSSGKTVYLDQDSAGQYRAASWDVMVGFANLDSLFDAGKNALEYGLSASGAAFYRGETLTAGADVAGDATMVTLMGPRYSSWSGAAVGSLSIRALSEYFAIRGGCAAFGFGAESGSGSSFITPTVGLAFRDVPLGQIGRALWAMDYYPAHLWEGDMRFAFGTQLLASFSLAKLGAFDVFVQTGVRDSLFVYSSSVRNDAKLLLAIGVGNHE